MYINNAGDLYFWGIDSSYYYGTGYNAGTLKRRKNKINIPYDDPTNRKAWNGDATLQHYKTDIEGNALEKFSDMGKVRQVEFGNEGIMVLTENGRVYTCGYSGYGVTGHENDGLHRYSMTHRRRGGKLGVAFPGQKII